jgi:hypothetical protein
MSRPHEGRIRRVIHILPPTDERLQELAEEHGTLGRVIDAKLGAVPKAKKRRAKAESTPIPPA